MAFSIYAQHCHDQLLVLVYHCVRAFVRYNLMKLVFIKTVDQLADIMTKPLSSKDHVRHTDVLLKQNIHDQS